MAYVELDLPDTLPDSVRFVIRESVEPLFQDVHWMLSTTIGDPSDTRPRRQLQMPIAHTLLATVSGISTKLYCGPGNAGAGERFKKCLVTFFPWDIDPPEGVNNEEAAKILYDVFRNPLVHRLGLSDRKNHVVKITHIFRGTGTTDAEKRVEELERQICKPYSDPCLMVTADERKLFLDPFYWGIRKLVERWARDEKEVLHADRNLTYRNT